MSTKNVSKGAANNNPEVDALKAALVGLAGADALVFMGLIKEDVRNRAATALSAAVSGHTPEAIAQFFTKQS